MIEKLGYSVSIRTRHPLFPALILVTGVGILLGFTKVAMCFHARYECFLCLFCDHSLVMDPNGFRVGETSLPFICNDDHSLIQQLWILRASPELS